jgi:hypothetical protein
VKAVRLGTPFLLGLLGCGDPLVEPEEIEDLRVLGAVAEVVTDPARATPRRGEEVAIRVLVAGPEGPAPATFGIVACRAAETTTGLPICDEELARTSVEVPTTDSPSITLLIPTDLATDRVALIGVVCEDGAPVLSTDAAQARCRGGGRTARFVLDVPVAEAQGDENANPPLPEDVASIAGEPWNELLLDPCDPAAEPRVTAGSRQALRLDLRGAAERVDGEGKETLSIAHYVTSGDLERHFSVVEDGGRPVVEVDWSAPATAPAGGAPMHFYAVVRDGRGGAAWVHRALCVTE